FPGNATATTDGSTICDQRARELLSHGHRSQRIPDPGSRIPDPDTNTSTEAHSYDSRTHIRHDRPGGWRTGSGAVGPEDADYRSGSHVPLPDLLQVVLRVQQEEPER